MAHANHMQEQPLTLQAAARRSSITFPELILRKATRPNQCFLIVEGPDEYVILQPHRAANCTIYSQDGKDDVLKLIMLANTRNIHQRGSLEGVVGLVDRDFDHLQATPARPARLGWTTPAFNDLESAALYSSGAAVLAGFVSNDALQSDRWLALQNGHAFDFLVERFVAPIGALRAAYQETHPHTSLEPGGAQPLIDRAWKHASPTAALQLSILLDLLPSGLSVGDRGSIQVRLRAMLQALFADPESAWDYVRGKDLVRAIALALIESPAALYDRLLVKDLTVKLHQRLLDHMDAAALRNCGTFDSIAEASAADSIRYEYLKAV